MKILFVVPLLVFFSSCCTTVPGVSPPSPPEQAIQVETLLKSAESWDGAPLPAYAEGQPEVTILRITIAPGTALPEHKHPYMNAGVLESGELEVTLESGKTMRLKAGDSLAEVVNTWHFGRNVGDTPAVILVVYAGIKGEPVTVLREKTGGR